MRRRTIIGALGLSVVGVFLGVTVLRDQIANASALAQEVTVTNTLLPVLEQNLDGGNIKVHEQGTANVNVINTRLVVAPEAPITEGGSFTILSTAKGQDLAVPYIASAFSISMSPDVDILDFAYQGQSVANFTGPAFVQETFPHPRSTREIRVSAVSSLK